MKVMRKLIHIDEELCNGCGQCVPGCEEGALQIIDGKAKLVAEKYCDGLGACLGECPTGALTVREVEADDFDPDAVASLLKEQGREIPDHMPDPASLRLAPAKPRGCPSAQLKTMTPCQQANIPASQQGSSLSHWPIQLRLVPPDAPFLKDSHLLLTADCTAVALPNFHSEYLPGKTVMMACPKFDDVQSYLVKLTQIFQTSGIEKITLLEMEVPCCSNMSAIVSQAMKQAGANIPVERIIVGREGNILSETTLQS